MPKSPVSVVDPRNARIAAADDGFLRLVYRAAPLGIARLAPDGRFLDVNPGLCALLGCPAEGLRGRSLFDIGPDDEIALTREAWGLMQRGDSERAVVERRCRRPAGDEIWLRLSLLGLPRGQGDGGLPADRLALFEDIGARRALEAGFEGERVQHGQEVRRLKQSDRESRERSDEVHGMLVHVSESTLRQVGQELHDDVGQILAGAAMLAGTMARTLAQHQQAEAPLAGRLAGLLNDAVGKLRAVSRGLFPIGLETAGLSAMLDALAIQLRASTPLDIQMQQGGDGPRLCALLTEEQALQIYRIVQEAASNAVRHSGAKALCLSVGNRPGALSVVVADDGFGIERDRRQRGGIGLRTMHARAARIGASLRIHTPAEGGTRVELELPLPARVELAAA